MKRINIIFLFSIMLFSLSCKSQKEMKEKVNIIDQEFYEYTGIKEQKSWIIQNNEDWQKIHNRIFKGQQPTPKLKDVDFNKNSVVVISFGEKSNGGFSVKAESYEKLNNELFFKLNSPKLDPMSPVTMALTQPVLVIDIPKTSANEVVYNINN